MISTPSRLKGARVIFGFGLVCITQTSGQGLLALVQGLIKDHQGPQSMLSLYLVGRCRHTSPSCACRDCDHVSKYQSSFKVRWMPPATSFSFIREIRSSPEVPQHPSSIYFRPKLVTSFQLGHFFPIATEARKSSFWQRKDGSHHFLGPIMNHPQNQGISLSGTISRIFFCCSCVLKGICGITT